MLFVVVCDLLVGGVWVFAQLILGCFMFVVFADWLFYVMGFV